MTRLRTRWHIAAGATGVLLVSMAMFVGCSSAPPAATPPGATPPAATLPEATPSAVFCDNASQLVSAATSSVTPSPSRESVERGIETVRSLVEAMGRTGTADVGASDWAAVAEDYRAVQRAFRNAGGDSRDGDFIWTLAVAVDKQNAAVGQWGGAVQAQCGVDLQPLHVGK